jgi:hypothetical protein
MKPREKQMWEEVETAKEFGQMQVHAHPKHDAAASQ